MNTKILLTSISAAFFTACSSNIKTIKPEVKTLTEAVYASGNVFPEEEYLVFANADGLLENVLTEPGDSVSKGQLLFKIENEIQTVRQKTAQEIYNTVKRNVDPDSPYLREVKAKLENARVKMENDSINFVRYQNLLNSNATAKAEFDKALMAYSVSKNDYKVIKNSYEKLKRQLYIELQNAENQYKISEREKGNYIVKANIEGIIYDVFKEKGEAVRRNEPLALLGNSDRFVLQLNVDEQDISKVKPGQDVLVKIDLENDKVRKAKVVKIHPKLNIQDQSFRVDAVFTGEKPLLYYGITVEANIIVKTKENVLTIPKNVLVASDSVWINTDEGEEKVKIVRGIEDFDYIEILSGLNENSEIIKK